MRYTRVFSVPTARRTSRMPRPPADTRCRVRPRRHGLGDVPVTGVYFREVVEESSDVAQRSVPLFIVGLRGTFSVEVSTATARVPAGLGRPVEDTTGRVIRRAASATSRDATPLAR